MADEGWAHPELLCETEWLAEHLEDPGLVVVDCDLLPAYLRLHIPGAVWAGSRYWKRGGTDTEVYGMDDPAEFAKMMGRIGVGNESLVVGYDGSGGLFAARLWWTLDRFGFHNFKLLNGGLEKWYAEGRPLSKENVRLERTQFAAQPVDLHWTCTLDQVAESIGDADHVFWDVRSDGEWTGENARGMKRGGRIPGAVHLEWLKTLNEPLPTLKPPAELRALLGGLGIPSEKRVTTYCQGGIRAAQALFLLRLLGYEQIGDYDGSWREYGNALEQPIETG